ncbi:hypothetical protein ACKKBF_B17105 [Auxenochlorella protothecoides x Auxenochlorella symbiontica]
MRSSARTLTATVWLLLSVTLQANAQLANCSAPRPGATAAPGCLCGQDVQQSCGDGLVCSQPTSVALASDAEAGSVPFLCIPCVFGQYCPEGTALPAFRDPGFQTAMKGLECRSGFYCPSPLAQLPCPQGAFCGPGSVAPTTCAMDELLRTSPNMELPQRPTTVYSSVYVDGDTLGGNYCPANSSTPSTQCAGGTYCPSPGLALPCPKGSFCKPGSKDPSPCPFLTSCPPGSSKAALSWTGFILLAGILLGLLAAYCTAEALMRMAQRRQLHTQEARDRLWKLLNPLFAPHHRRGEGSFRAFNSIRPRLHIEFRNLGLELHDGRTILSGVTGRFEHSKVSAVMGPSGAGKTTFLSVLMGQSSSHGKTMGSLRINGRSVGIPDLQSVVGFVPQEDLVHEDLTVRENLVYSARLRLSTSKPRQEQMDIVDDVLDVLQLRHVQHQIVGSVERRGISGGQRKRVSIGLELAAKPSILFMDEPTSGLDATAAADILQALKRMAGLGMNVIAVLHQPRFSIFALFDDIMLLGKGGRLVYLGPSWLAMPYFESLDFELPLHENPADFVMDVISGSVPQRGCDAFHPERLVGLWQTYGLSWVRTQSKLMPLDPTYGSRPPEQLRIDPEQFALLSEQFDAADADGDDALRAGDLQVLLRALGLEPSTLDIQMIMAELAIPRTGLVSKEAFMQYVQYGGRPPASAPDGPPSASGRRAVQSIYRVYSIEQYTLSAAIAELSAAALPSGLRPAGNLKELASAVVAGGELGRSRGGRGDAGGGATGAAAPGHEDEDHSPTRIMSPRFCVIPLEESSTGSPRRGAGAPPLPPVAEEGEEEGGGDPLVHSRSSTATHDAPVAIRFDRPGAGYGEGVEEQGLRAAWEAVVRGRGEEDKGASGSVTPDLKLSCCEELGGANGGASGRATPDAVRSHTPSASGTDARGGSAGSLATLDEARGRRAPCGGLMRCWRRPGRSVLRVTPGWGRQYAFLLVRAGIKLSRAWGTKFLDLLLLVFAGIVTGAMHGTGWTNWDFKGHIALIMLTLGIIAASGALAVFGKERLVHWRERESGVRVFSYFMANSTTNMVDVFIQPLVFLSVYYSMTIPSISFGLLYVIGVLVVFWCASLGCLMSIIMGNNSALVASVAILMVIGGFINGVNPVYRSLSPLLKGITVLSYNRWAADAAAIWDFREQPPWQWPLTRSIMFASGQCGLDSIEEPTAGSGLVPEALLNMSLDINVYCAGEARKGLLILGAQGLILRMLAFFALLWCPRGISFDPLIRWVSRGVTRVTKPLRRHTKTTSTHPVQL